MLSLGDLSTQWLGQTRLDYIALRSIFYDLTSSKHS